MNNFSKKEKLVGVMKINLWRLIKITLVILFELPQGTNLASMNEKNCLIKVRQIFLFITLLINFSKINHTNF